MRILLFVSSIIIAFAPAKSQQSEVVSITTKDRVFEGKIDDSYDITMYLKVVKRSENNGFIQSVTGWYSYNEVGIPIPLAGLIGSDIHLVSSSDPHVLDQIISFEYQSDKGLVKLDSYIHKVVDNMAMVKNVNERFDLDYDGGQIVGSWQGNNKHLKVELFADEFRVTATKHYLKLANGDFFDLSYLGLPEWSSIDIEATSNTGRNIILDYYFQANLNYMGRCGAAENKGKVGLVFNENYELVKSSVVVFEDCYRDIYTLKEDKISDAISKYEIEYFENSDNPEYVYCTVDLVNATITRK